MRNLIKIAVLLLISGQALAEAPLLTARVSLDQATQQIIRDGKSRVLGAQTVIIEGREVHIIKILTPDGRIQHLKIDAETGAVIS
ncbi:PepSY domain-containing protein [Methylosarcina fibrata]|uniref:PepSY domain-containing protein n=1 Tax=Methylosarcina fibrata TaxID=105972 RepID=UPI00036F5943|nr:PepSY domain-containing protein [Methylosarcina fibrata]